MLPDQMTPEQIQQVNEMMETIDPPLWRACYPRIYEEPKCGTYYSPKQPARQMFGIGMKFKQGLIGQSEQYEFIAASHLAKFRVPMFWLSPDIAQAIRQTTPPGEIEWYDMPLPFESGVFMLPKGTLTHKTDGDVEFVAYVRLKAGEQHMSRLIPGTPYGSKNGSMVLLALVHNKWLIHWNIPLTGFNRKTTLPDLDEKLMTYGGENHHTTGVWFGEQPTMTLEDNLLGLEVAHYIFGTLLLMTDRPDLVTHGGLRKKVPGKRGNEVKEFWSPNVIGETYRIRRIAEDQGGTHASPRFHWVKGFYRMTAYGEGRALRKRDWIEPFMRGLPEEASTRK